MSAGVFGSFQWVYRRCLAEGPGWMTSNCCFLFLAFYVLIDVERVAFGRPSIALRHLVCSPATFVALI
ncbi:uncharacterized protein BDW43DRAFT_57741 [Aspergillus alliaceus]|uniref:uncharacterized protein n=1 Tax=Petromyces alliaceus TaxID=209559 RepID=UPI0012A68153|nr:uncharacterized protein BDW43DRAFT_57741 [Aspergillus alliaceus]KAB8234582.1 hypothetical protein BDW43DRAFT_57741 [Aspergillus alliaceus]